MTDDPVRIGWALAAALLWLALIAIIRLRIRRQEALAGVAVADDAPLLPVVYSSQTGLAERIAQATAGTLRASGVNAQVMPLALIDAARLKAAGRALFIVSTTGEGDPPDGSVRFAARQLAIPADLGDLRYAMLALGDLRYREYCGFGHRVDRWLRASGAQPDADLIEVDDGDAGALRHWQAGLRLYGASGNVSDWVPPTYSSWRMVKRTVLNPGSPGAALCHIVLRPEGELPIWRAGDIAELYPGPAAPALAGKARLPHRDYSVASLPGDGTIELVVRRMTLPDGLAGLGSGWLCDRAQPGTRIALRLRDNRAFHPPEPQRPLILIGNGSGIAGLRAHLKARPAGTRNWLCYGERSPAADRPFADELDAWRSCGHLERVDLAFSRGAEPGQPYVQHRLAAEADVLRAWVADGAAIYICGSLEGMAAGVDAALTDVLGRDTLDSLADEGRYRRDVY